MVLLSGTLKKIEDFVYSLLALSMSLSRLSVARPGVQQMIAIRLAHVYKPATKQLQVPSGTQGFFRYERDVSRDRRYANPQKPGDTPYR